MKATAEIQVIPLGVGVSVRREVRRAHELLEESGLIIETHASGTDVEGDLAQILQAVERVHEALHAEGTVRLVTRREARDADRQGADARRQAALIGGSRDAERLGSTRRCAPRSAGGPDRDSREITSAIQEDLR